jgi:hypothetical protein
MGGGGAYCKASHRVITAALSLSIGAGLKKIRERLRTRRFLFDLEVLGIRQSRDEPFMKAWGQFHREFPGIRNTHIVHFYLEGFVAF